MSSAPATPLVTDLIMDRLDDQIAYYEAKSGKCQRYYKRIKLVEIIAAALIPFLAALHVAENHPTVRITLAMLTAVLGVLITILEGVLQLNQYQQIWITYRATAEAMKHEKFMCLAMAGAYASAADAHALLAERIEAISSQENIRWASLQQLPQKGKTGG